MQDPFGWSGPPNPEAFDPGVMEELQRGAIAGNTEYARDLAGPRATPNTFGLPKGVSVNDNMTEDGGGATMDTPSQPSQPMLQNAMVSQGLPASGGPTRRSASSPSIYGESRSPSLFGRADGLLGGGKGLVGAEETSGPLAPTEMMQKLLQLFRMRGEA